MILVAFRARVRPGAPLDEIEALGARMLELASAMPGYVSYRDYQSADGESLTLVEFQSAETLRAWRDHPEHRAAQAMGRERYFASYRISVCDVARESVFDA